jgi:hypothetical protein
MELGTNQRTHRCWPGPKVVINTGRNLVDARSTNRSSTAVHNATGQLHFPQLLSARNYFNTGQSDQAVQELIAASGKQQLQDYSMDFVRNATKLFSRRVTR